MKAELPAVVFTGPISRYLNPILALSAQTPEEERQQAYAASPLRLTPRTSQRLKKDSPERAEAPPRPISPPRPYATAGTIISRKQLQLVSVAAVQATPLFAMLHADKAALLQSLLRLQNEPQVQDAEAALEDWAPLPSTSAFEYGSGRVLQPADSCDVLKATTGRARVLQAASLLAKVQAGRHFVAWQEERHKLAKAREAYFTNLRLFVAQQSKLRREKVKSAAGVDIPFLVPGPGLEDSKHLTCLSKGKKPAAKRPPDSKPQSSLETAEFKLSMLKNIYEKQLLKVVFQAIGLEHRSRSAVHQVVETVQHKALMLSGHLALAGWVHIIQTKVETENLLEMAQERLLTHRKRSVLATLFAYSRRAEMKQERLSRAEKFYELQLKSTLLYHFRVAIVARTRKRILLEMADERARVSLLSRAFSEFREQVLSTLVIKEKLTQKPHLHSPVRSDKSRHFSLLRARTDPFTTELRTLRFPSRSRSRPRKASTMQLFRSANETIQTPRLEVLSPKSCDPVLAKYLTASQRREVATPEEKTIQVHRRYAEHQHKYNPEELEPPIETKTPEYWPLDVGLIATPASPSFPPLSDEESIVASSMEESVDSLPSVEFRFDMQPRLAKDRLVMQIRSLWLYYRTLKRVGPTFHTLRARKTLAVRRPEDVINTFIQSRRTSKFFTSWKRAYLTRFLLRHLEVFSSLHAAQLSLRGLWSLAEQRRVSDSRASSLYEYKLKQKALEKWTSSGRVSEETLYRFRLQRVIDAWKDHQRQIAAKLLATIKARKKYQSSLQQKALFAWDRYVLRETRCTAMAHRLATTRTWRLWLRKTRARLLLKRVISQGLENYKDSEIAQLRSDANLLTTVLQGWRKVSCKKRKSRQSQLMTLTALNWRAQKVKVVVFFKWKERAHILKGVNLLASHWSRKVLFCMRQWHSKSAAFRSRETDAAQYRRGWLLQRVVEKWSEWVLQEKIVRALQKRRAVRGWRAGVYHVKQLPTRYFTRRTAKRWFLAWKRLWEKEGSKRRYQLALQQHFRQGERRVKERMLAKFIANWLIKSKSRRLKLVERRCRLQVAFHSYIRKAKTLVSRHQKYAHLYAKLHAFRRKSIKRINPQVRQHYLSLTFQSMKQRYQQRKKVLGRFVELPYSLLREALGRLQDCSQSLVRYEETLKYSSKRSEFDSLFRSLEDTYMKSSLYRDTRPRKVRFEGEMDTSSVGARVQEICAEAQESWLDQYQRKEQEKRAEIHRELDSLQASLLSSLSSKGSRSGRLDQR